jgi:AcrR family transcriptional regulator
MRTVNPQLHARQRRKILDVACSLLARQGYSRTTLDQIAHASRMKKPSLYHYFPGKEAILHELIHSRLREAHAPLAQNAPVRGLEQALYQYGADFLSSLAVRRNQDFLLLLMRDSFNDPLVRKTLLAALKQRMTLGAAVLRDLPAGPALRRYYRLGLHQFMNALLRYAVESRVWKTTPWGRVQDREYLGCLAKIFASGLRHLAACPPERTFSS